MTRAYEMTVFSNDKECTEAIPRTKSVKILVKPSQASARAGNIFVLTTATKLVEVAEFVRRANECHRLRALFIHSDVDPKLLPQMLDRAKLRVLRNTLVHAGPELPRRVMQAWQHGMQHELIALADRIGDRLLVVTCAFETLEAAFDDVAALRGIAVSERSRFEVSSEGSYIHWPAGDVHVDIDSLRYATNPDWRKRQDLLRLRDDKRFGAAIVRLRKKRGLKQTDIDGVSERQLRRIESGDSATVNTLECLARSHGLSLKEYLNSIAQEIRRSPIGSEGAKIKPD